ncbi:MAG: beta-lactamase family protein, partial [Firmicutes bacterium]|nr:beta-lactamase family protein [Bacillota bacterium]
MLERVLPEQVGVSSADVQKYISVLERAHLSTHNVIMIRHGKIFYENYWAPFHKDFLHRMYSVSKSFVSIVIGFLEQEGKLALTDKIVDLFDPEIVENVGGNVKYQTVRDMLMMSTGFPDEHSFWFDLAPKDRLKAYFDESGNGGTSRIPGATFVYDSWGSFVLGSLVEDLTGMSLMDYLRGKVFDKIGVSKEAYCLKCPGGHSWGDSAVMCKAEDLARMVLFTMNLGEWEGEQLLNKEYLQAATSNLIDTDSEGHLVPSSYGYGYQIWRTRQNSFYFNGMGCQYGIAIPDKDMVFVINADNQGIPTAATTIIDRFFEEVVDHVQDEPLAENPAAYQALMDYSKGLKLYNYTGSVEDNWAQKISGKKYMLNPNPMGIEWMKLTFEGDEGVMEYKNAQGEKKLAFGVDKNVFGKFPQEGYADLVGAT